MTALDLRPALVSDPRSEVRRLRFPIVRTARRVRDLVLVVVPVFLLSSFITFGLGALSDSNPAAAVLGDTATPDDIARMSHEFGLDRPFLVQYASWLGHLLTGDLGRSWFTTMPVADGLRTALPVDLSIAGLAILLAVAVGGAAGIAAALRSGGRFDRSVTVVCAVVGTLPPFIVGIGLVVLLSVTVRLFPSGGYVPLAEDPGAWLRSIALPGIALSLDVAANLARQLRNSLVGALRENYVVGAEVRGLSARRVLFRHVLRNASGPALTVLGMSIPFLIGGAVVTETVFSLPGIGQLALEAAERHDVPVVQGTLLTTIVLVLVSNLVVNAALLRLRPQAGR